MSTINPLYGTATVAQRSNQQSLVFKALARRIASNTRCGLPGIIRTFDPVTQYAKVKLAITENLIQQIAGVTPTALPDLEDVLVLFPGDANWCLTFPTLVGSECYVCFADMCINAWATHGFKNVNGKPYPQDQELQRRHDLSDGFAILAPRSQPHRIPSYSTTAVELRSMDANTKLSLDGGGNVLFKGTGMEIDGTAGVIVSGVTPSNCCIKLKINGVFYYVRLSTAP